MTFLRIRVSAVCKESDSLLLVEHEKDGRRYWLLPGGGMERGEAAEDAVVREVLEETSLRIRPGRILCVCDSISPGGARHIVHFIYEAALESIREDKARRPCNRDPRVRGHEFVPISSLQKMTIYPPIQGWLAKGLSEGFPATPEYLGALWE